MAVVWIIAGLLALIFGAELIVRGGTRVAARLGIPPILIGLTIVSVGTSTPELAVGIEAAARGNGALAVGNIAGTNTVNLLLIFGLSALLRPLAVSARTVRFDLPAMTFVAVGFMVMAWDGLLTRADGAVMVFGALAYTVAIIYLSKAESRAIQLEFAEEFGGGRRRSSDASALWGSIALIAGIFVVVVGSDWLVDGSVALARKMGVSEALIGLTIVAIGTSSPELVTTVVGTLRNDRDIAIGNLLGSSIYNILAILGITCLIASVPLSVEPALLAIDIPVMTAATLACIPLFLTERRVSRIEGGVLVASYLIYLLYLVIVRL
jgi:cation:H+ antiporter